MVYLSSIRDQYTLVGSSRKPGSPPYKNNPPHAGDYPKQTPQAGEAKNKASYSLMMIGRFVTSPAGKAKTGHAL